MAAVSGAMGGRRWAFAWALAVALATVGCGEGAREDAPAPAQRASDKPAAPDFVLRDLEGREVSLAEMRGRPVVIDFWATWCTPCVFQIPILNEFYQAHRDDGVVVLGISVDVDGPEAVAAFAREHRITYPVLLGSESLAWRYGAPGFPALAVVDPEGRIDSLHVGVISREDLEEALAPWLAGEPREEPARGRAEGVPAGA